MVMRRLWEEADGEPKRLVLQSTVDQANEDRAIEGSEVQKVSFRYLDKKLGTSKAVFEILQQLTPPGEGSMLMSGAQIEVSARDKDAARQTLQELVDLRILRQHNDRFGLYHDSLQPLVRHWLELQKERTVDETKRAAKDEALRVLEERWGKELNDERKRLQEEKGRCEVATQRAARAEMLAGLFAPIQTTDSERELEMSQSPITRSKGAYVVEIDPRAATVRVRTANGTDSEAVPLGGTPEFAAFTVSKDALVIKLRGDSYQLIDLTNFQLEALKPQAVYARLLEKPTVEATAVQVRTVEPEHSFDEAFVFSEWEP